MGQATITLGDLRFALRLSTRRKTMSVVIERDGTLSLLAPTAATERQLAKFIDDKRMWIFRKLAERELLARQTERKEFVTGEGFWYLGRTYRLRLVDRQNSQLKLLNGRFLLERAEQSRARNHFIHWYCEHGKVWLERRVSFWADRMAVMPGPLRVRELGCRWGSCGKSNQLNFHWALLTLPREIIDYVIVHELAHIDLPNHSQRFWRIVERTMPDYTQRKLWLDQCGGRYISL